MRHNHIVTIAALTDYHVFMNSMAALIGCQPRLLRLFMTDPRVWWKCMVAPITGAQFRLFGTYEVQGIIYYAFLGLSK